MKFNISSLTNFKNSVLLGVLVISLWITPCAQADLIVDVGQTLDTPITYDVDGALEVFGTANLDMGAFAALGIYVFHGPEVGEPGSTLNVYGCASGNSLWVIEQDEFRYPGLPPAVTIYGDRFQIGTNDPFDPPFDTPISGMLNVLSQSGDVLFSLWISSDTDIHLRAPGSSEEEEPLEIKKLWVSKKIIQRHVIKPRKLSAHLIMPEGVTKDDIDNDSPIMLYVNNNEVGIEANYQKILEHCFRRKNVIRTSIMASFEMAKLMEAATDDGETQLRIGGCLKSGQKFYGKITIKIVDYQKKPWKHSYIKKCVDNKKYSVSKNCKKKK